MTAVYRRATKRAAPAKRATSFEPAIAKAFGNAVRTTRESLGLAQDEFALKAGVDRSYYGKLERGERQPSLALLLRIAGALGLSGGKLVELTELSLRRPRRLSD